MRRVDECLDGLEVYVVSKVHRLEHPNTQIRLYFPNHFRGVVGREVRILFSRSSHSLDISLFPCFLRRNSPKVRTSKKSEEPYPIEVQCDVTVGI